MTVFCQMMVDLTMSLFPLLGKDPIIRHHSLLDPIGGTQGLQTTLFGIRLDPPDLGAVCPPFHLSIVHLKEID